MNTQSANVRWQLWIVAIGFFMQTLDTTIVNTAIQAMAHDLGVSPLHMHSVIVYYVLTVAVMLPVSGWLADRFGVRNIFFSAIVLFSLGSLLCALSTTLDQLVLDLPDQYSGRHCGCRCHPDADAQLRDANPTV